PDSVIVEEFVDNIHFLLSLGLEKGYRFSEIEVLTDKQTVTNQFIDVFNKALCFYKEQTEEAFLSLFQVFLQLGKKLGFTVEDIFQAKDKKIEENNERQDKDNKIILGGNEMKKFDEILTMLKDLTDANAISGQEKEAREVMEKYITPYANEVYTDHLGSLIAKKTGEEDGPKIMVAGHLDEVGFMVTRIDEKGFLF